MAMFSMLSKKGNICYTLHGRFIVMRARSKDDKQINKTAQYDSFVVVSLKTTTYKQRKKKLDFDSDTCVPV